MRIMIETRDAVDQWSTFIAHTNEELAYLLTLVTKEYTGTFDDRDEQRMFDFLNKMADQIKRGFWGRGDDASQEIDGCLFAFSYLDDSSKHSNRTWKSTYCFGPLMGSDLSPWEHRTNVVLESHKGMWHDPSGNEYN